MNSNLSLTAMGKIGFIVFSLLISMTSWADSWSYHRVRTEKCQPYMVRKLQASSDRAIERVPYMMQKVRQLIESGVARETESKLRGAYSILSCAFKKLRKIYYSCRWVDRSSEDRVAGTFWVFGKRVKIFVKPARRMNKDQLASILLHEATHKCGTDDITYYGRRTGNHPDDDAYLEWQNTASLYDWWFMRGVCIPGESC